MNEILPAGVPLLEATWAVLALAVLGSGLAVVTRKNPVAAVAWLVVHFVATACLYVVLNAQFVAAIQVLVYAGAIIVLFLFVIMLLRVDQEDGEPAAGIGRKILVGAASLGLLGFFGLVALTSGLALAPAGPGVPRAEQDTVEWISEALFTRHLVAFEAASVILVAGMAGVMVYSTRRRLAGSGERREGS